MQDIEVRVLSGPVSEKNPSVANIVAAMIGGFVLGVLLAMLWIVYKNGKQTQDDMLTRGSFTIAPKMPNPLERMAQAGNFESDDAYMENIRFRK
jgi:hypothetical protein